MTPLTVLQGRFSEYLPWNQPFLHRLITGVGGRVRNVVLCNRTRNLRRFPTPRIERLRRHILRRPTSALLTAAHLWRTWQPAVMHAHMGWSGLQMLSLKAFLQIPLVTTFVGRDVGTQMDLPEYRPLYQVLLAASDRIICVSEALRARLQARGVDGSRIEVVRRGVDLSEFRFVDRRGRDPAAPVRFLMVGRLVEKKGHRCALEALAPLVREGYRVRLDVVGSGSEKPQLRRLCRELGVARVVTFRGHMDHVGVQRCMEAADVLVHCSMTAADGDVEGVPNAVVEGAATGLPVVGTRHGGIGEVVEDQRTGLLVPEGDRTALREAMRQLVRDPSARLALGRLGRQRAEAELSVERQVARHLEIYEELAERYPAGSDGVRPIARVDRFFRRVRAVRPDRMQPDEPVLGVLVDGWLTNEVGWLGPWIERLLVTPTFAVGGALPDWARIPLKRRLARVLVEKWGMRSPAEYACLDEAATAYAMRGRGPASLVGFRTLDDIGRSLAGPVDGPRTTRRLPSWQGRP